ncbi:zinc fingers and homeoboxes protein 1 [Astyanax mexicanus]|uniref:Zinc fingers and homeoboxes protein 1-like n=1 Tax=Astyanax mexicanus TaxID=7994 RepID=A0A8B9HRB5_ASTMX|nr:zinc fingers and homeoboxes protein 1 [Astyanax mexicanus]
MEILGSTFDDSVFEESRNRASSSAVLPEYKPKSCEPEWFCHHEKFEDALDEQKTMKFRADLKYRRKQYQDALDDYTTCLSLVPNGNLSLKRDVLESMARCYSHLGLREQALETCENLRKEATNTCHLTCVLLLEVTIYDGCEDRRNSISSLQQLCSLHPFNPWHWLKLATSYHSLLESSSCLEKLAGLKASMCFVRTRLLLEILMIQQFSFVLEKSQRALKEIEESLQRLKLEESTLITISEVMAEDLIPEKMREENQDGESLSGLSIKDFDERWWNRLHTCLLMEKTDLSDNKTPENR